MTLQHDAQTPPEFPSLTDCASKDAFLVRGAHVDTWFERRSDILVVSFFNLATVGERDIPQPWFYGNIAQSGYSVLGLLTHEKDWYRNPDTPKILSELQEMGFFESFRRVLFVGASMGGFAALTYAPLVPGAAVLAFSPQSTLAPDIVPFEKRYARPQKRLDWTTPDYRDAAGGGFADISDVTIVFDPFVPEDKAHAARLTGKHVTQLYARHMGHQAIRTLKHVGALSDLFRAVAENRLDSREYYRSIRGRYSQIKWLRQFTAEATERGHWKLTLAAAKSLKSDDPRISRFLKRLQNRIVEKLNREQDHVFTAKGTSPEGPFAGKIAVLNNAIVVPPHQKSGKRAFGVLDQNLKWSKLSQSYLQERIRTKAPELLEGSALQELSGTHLFAGHFRGHFGHFLFESTVRLWAMEYLEEKPDSILYVPFRFTEPKDHQIITRYQDFFHLLGIDIPVQSFGSNLRVERLYVPELGFGWGGRFEGSPGYRKFMTSRLSAVAADGNVDQLYISRSRLPAHLGGIVGESVIERNLERLGYEIFHPQMHSIEAQLSKYKSARRIVSLDGCALHLVPFVMRTDCSVALIKRRSTANTNDYALQFRGFSGCEIKVIDALQSNWSSGDRKKTDFGSIGELDFEKVFSELKANGFISEDFIPELPTPQERAKMIDSVKRARAGNLTLIER